MTYSTIRSCWEGYWISEDGRQIVATIVAERHHGSREYQYLVNGIQYVGSGRSGRDFPMPALVGGQVLVYYSTSHPWLSSPQMPILRERNTLIGIALLLTGEFFIIKALINTRKRAHGKSA